MAMHLLFPPGRTGIRNRAIPGVIALVAILAMSPQMTLAQPVQQITFNDAVALALERNPSVRRAENNLELQSTNVFQAKANFLPNLSFSSGGSRNYGLQFDQTAGRLVTTASDGFNMSLSSGINIFNGFADVASVEQAQYTLEAQEYSYDRTRQTMVFTVISNYLSVIFAEENLGIQQENLESQQLLLNQIQEFVNAGTRAISDLYTQQATVASAEMSVLTAESTYQVAQTRLIQTLQLDPLGEYEFVAPDAEEIPLAIEEYNQEDLLLNAFENRSDLRAQESSIDASIQGIRIARAGYLPRLNFSGGLRTSYSGSRDADFSDQLNDNQSKSLSLSLNFPIFNKFATKAQVEGRQVAHANALLDLETLQQGVALEVRQAYYDYETAVKQLDVTAKQLQAAQQALEVEQERYNVGASTLVELTQSRSQFVRAASQRLQAIIGFHASKRYLQYYQGIMDPNQPLF
jgi:outer membrane protein